VNRLFCTVFVRHRLLKKIVSGFRIAERDGLWRLLYLLLVKSFGVLARIVDALGGGATTYNPYAGLALLKPIQCDVVSVNYDVKNITLPFSLITTVKNESANIVRFLQSIASQRLKPNEIVIVDGGSSDETCDLIRAYAAEAALPLSLFQGQSCNVAEGRNRALAACSYEIVVMADAGCLLDENYCLNLVGVFASIADVDLVGGIWKPIDRTRYNLQTPIWDDLQWDAFLPSARAMAVKKSICESIGGFPEYLTITGEDTLFDISYRRVSQKWAFNRNAFVLWHAPTSRERERKVAFHYGMGDGENGVGDFTYYHLLKGASSLQRWALVSPEEFAGYLKGRKNRSTVETKRRNIAGLVIILSEMPFTDSDGDQRGVKLAIEYINQNYKVFFINRFPLLKVNSKVFFPIDYSLLELYALTDFDCDELAERYHGYSGEMLVISESLLPEFAPIIQRLTNLFHHCTHICRHLPLQETHKRVET